MNLSDLDGVISQEVMPLELKVSTLSEESEYFSVVVKELLLGWNTSTSELFLKELEELWVLLWWDWLLRVGKGILWADLSFTL